MNNSESESYLITYRSGEGDFDYRFSGSETLQDDVCTTIIKEGIEPSTIQVWKKTSMQVKLVIEEIDE